MADPTETDPPLDLTPKEQTLIDQLYRTLEKGTFYTLLGIPPDAEPGRVRQAYYEMSRHWHPDRFFRREVGEYADRIEAIFVAVTQAYQTLSDARKREAYDKELKKRQRKPGAPAPSAPAGASSSAPAFTGEDAPPRAASPGPTPARAPAADPDRSERARVDTPFEDDIPTDEAPLPGSTPRSVPPNGRANPAANPANPASTPSASNPARGLRAPPPRPRGRLRQQLVDQVRQDVIKGMRQAREYFDTGKKDLDEGNFVKAESALYLALQLEPKNPEYKALYEQARQQSRKARAQQFVAAGESAESYQHLAEAIYNYRKAVECEIDDGKVYYRLAKLLKRQDKDSREALQFLRTAALKDPENPEYRIALAEVYVELNLTLNARREYQAALQHSKSKDQKDRVKEGLAKLR